MIDVHPPHQATHTWTDFFIHIATICVGLLIAIGLEQTVETLHHHHERDELILAMRAEAQSNRPIFDRALSYHVTTLAWYRSVVTAVTQASPHNGMVDVTLPPYPSIPGVPFPDRATWAIAKANGKAALLPDNLAEDYNRLDFEADMEQQAYAAYAAAALALDAITMRLGIDLHHDSRLHLSVADRDALAQALAQRSAAWSAAITRTAYWRGANNAVADGVQSLKAMEPYLTRSADAIRQAEAQAAPSASATSGNPSASQAAQEPAR